MKVAQAARVMERSDAGSSGSGQGAERPAWLQRIVGSWQDFRKFLHDVRGEMGHVTWPSTIEVRSQTLIVIVTIFFFGAFFYVVDSGFGKLIQTILSKFGHS
jgi:preprotein translocase subunit SecE